MKWLLIPATCAALAAMVAFRSPAEREITFVFTGDIRGYLSPCGCAKPMVGGILRMATVVRALLEQPNSYFVDGGNLTGASGRQDELKAETLMETFRGLEAKYVNVGPLDRRLGVDYIRVLFEMSGGILGTVDPDGKQLEVQGVKIVNGKFSVEGVSQTTGVVRPAAPSLHRIVLYSGDKEKAIKFAEANPDVQLVLFSSQGDPMQKPIQVGNCTVVSAGDKCRFVGKIDFVDGKWTGFRAIELGPSIADDPRASTAYKTYLSRVTSEKLLEKLPRTAAGDKYIGTMKCAPCHQREYAIWKKTPHAQALKTLETTGNDRDPECVGCHVVGLDAVSGFRDRKLTAQLADVGCESCHGPGHAHSQNVTRPYGKAGEASCMKCHVSDHSPGFNFAKFWEKIKH